VEKQEVDLSEVKQLLEQRLSEAEKRLEAKLQASLKPLSERLSSLPQSQEHSKVPVHNHPELVRAIQAVNARLDKTIDTAKANFDDITARLDKRA
jgi:hypothetical protein